jgi:hypothetical protein
MGRRVATSTEAGAVEFICPSDIHFSDALTLYRCRERMPPILSSDDASRRRAAI